ncbi:hypothetical protein [Corynebacterium guangdongense]|uniref:Urease accessory protein UreD n=1 Tax=Corynebacterium guangdongense TaxID=1783348 RepID=A0ABU2A101_9CORY|nr:hypothetical protein [Corynebacterium guangdongense]MDR7330695.1 hypothetical protein [Corynebacterium guangdongense]WJZ16710.1 hypothetical protein CGUA_00505 [Corynebacterium guangdongense]
MAESFESMRRRAYLATGESTLEVGGKRVIDRLRIPVTVEDPRSLSVRIASRRPQGQVAVRFDAHACGLVMADGVSARSVRFIHGQSADGRLGVTGVGEGAYVSVINEYLEDGEFRSGGGDAGMVTESEGRRIHVRANGSKPYDRMLFEDVEVWIDLDREVTVTAGALDPYPHFPFAEYLFFESGSDTEGLRGEELQQSVCVRNRSGAIGPKLQEVLGAYHAQGKRLDWSGDRVVQLCADLEEVDENTLVERAREAGVCLMRVADGALLYEPR